MIVIPAIDIRGGNCVRLRQGRPEEETVYFSDPLSVARQFEEDGAERIHIVDLDGAFSGTMKNREIIKKIASSVKVPLQVGGGIRDFLAIKELFGAGVSRVIMGTSAIKDRDLLRRALKNWPGKISVGIDSESGNVAIGGWTDVTSTKAESLASEIEKEGVDEIIVTDIKTDGMLTGPNFEWVEKIARSLSISVIASGGVSSIRDIERIRDLEPGNITGIIVGKALYSGGFSLKEAIEAGRNN